MFKHILLPVDGSEIALRAVRTGIELAKLCQARIYALRVIPHIQGGGAVSMDAMLAASELVYNDAKAEAERNLAQVRTLVEAAGVPFDSQVVIGDPPSEIILRIVEEQQCDVVVMGSRGRRGLTRLLLGSETQKVLLNGNVPVLVCR